MDWPKELEESGEGLNLQIRLIFKHRENDRYSISQISGGYYDLNIVAFYILKGRLWPAPGSADTELGVLMEPEVCHGEAEVYTRVQA